MKKAKTEMLTPRQYAQKHEVAYTTVMKWLQNGLIRGVQKVPLFNGYMYQIPPDATPPDMKPGPKPKAAKKKAQARKRDMPKD